MTRLNASITLDFSIADEITFVTLRLLRLLTLGLLAMHVMKIGLYSTFINKIMAL